MSDRCPRLFGPRTPGPGEVDFIHHPKVLDPPSAGGRHVPRAWGTLAAVAGSELLARLPAAGPRLRPWFDIAAAALGLLGSYHLRSSLVQAGHATANDPRSRP